VTVRATHTASGTFDESTVTVTAAPPGGGANLLTNPSFEQGTTGWLGVGATISSVVDPAPADGTRVLRAVRSSGATWGVEPSGYPVSSGTAGDTYQARAQVRAAAPSSVGKSAYIHILEFTSAGTFVKLTQGPVVTLGTAFQQVSASAAVSANGNRLDLRIWQGGGATGNAIDIDAASVSKL
jgi:hypothetical protein